jgi:hypothetical protein
MKALREDCELMLLLDEKNVRAIKGVFGEIGGKWPTVRTRDLKLVTVAVAALALTVISLLTGCAGHGVMGAGLPLPVPGGYPYTITSLPAGADIYFNGRLIGKAPLKWTRLLLLQTVQTVTIEAWFPDSLGVSTVSGNNYLPQPKITENAEVSGWPSHTIITFRAPPQAGFNPKTVSPAILNHFLEMVETNDNLVLKSTNLGILQIIADISSNGGLAGRATERLDRLLGQSQDLIQLIEFSASLPSTKSTDAAAARAEQLIASWVQNRDDSKVQDMLKAGYASKAKGSPLAASALIGAETIVKNAWEVLSQDEYKKEFEAPDDSFPLLSDLMHEIRRKRGLPENESLTVTYHSGGNSTQPAITSSRANDGIVQLSLSMEGLHYSRREYDGARIVYEIVTRGGSRGGATVTTEVYHLHGLIYRMSKVTGL